MVHILLDCLAGEGLHKDLHSATQAQDQVESWLLLSVVIGKCAAIFQLSAGQDEKLLIRRNAFLILYLGLHVVDGVACFHVKGNCLLVRVSQRFAFRHAGATPSGALTLLNFVIGECAAIFQLFAGKDETLLIMRNALLILYPAAQVLWCHKIFPQLWCVFMRF